MATTFTVSSGDYIRPYRNCRVEYYPEAASQTYKIGDPLIFATASDKGNQVKIAGSDPTAIVGFAAEAASGTENTKVGVYVADPESEFLVRYADGQALDADDPSAAGYGIVADATNTIWRLDNTETSTKQFKVLRLIDAHGDINGRAVVKILAAARAAFV